MSYSLTSQQQAFVDYLIADPSSQSQRHVALVARAGTGKTSTILSAAKAMRTAWPALEIVICAYNKAIADEVKAKLATMGLADDWRKLSASTMHALGFGLVRYAFKPQIDDNKVRNLVKAVDGYDAQLASEYGAQIAQLVRLAKQAGVGFFGDMQIGDASVWYGLADHFDVNGFEDTTVTDEVVRIAQRVYRASLAQTDVIDFDDMILFPLIKNMRVKFQKDVIFLDEAQDLSKTRQALARKFLKRDGRMVIVGDDRQAIYGFSGADSDALPNMIKALDAKVMPLTVSWRCPQAVINLAQGLVPDIEAAPSAIEGSIEKVDTLPLAELKPGQDAVLCRNTAPLIDAAYKLIRAGIPAKVEGRAIGEGLKKLAQRWKVTTIAALLTRLDAYREREVQKAMAKDNEAKAEEVEDRVMTLVEICNACTLQGFKSVSDVVTFIDGLFADGDEKSVILATYHRSKGREWPRVWLIEHGARCPAKAARQAWQIQQEGNLAYVAFTRAQDTLTFVG